MTLTLRRATPEDLPAMMPLMERFNDAEHIPWEEARFERGMGKVLATPSLGFVLVALDGAQRLAGYTLCTFGYDLEFEGRDAYITELYIEPHARRLGLGRTLLREACAQARFEGAHAVHLMVTLNNAPAVGLYQSEGFRFEPRHMMTLLLHKQD